MTGNSTQKNTEIVADDELDLPNDLPPPAPNPMPSQETPLPHSTHTRKTLIQWGLDETKVSRKFSIAGLLGLVRMHHKVQSFMVYAVAIEDTQMFDFHDPMAYQAMT